MKVLRQIGALAAALCAQQVAVPADAPSRAARAGIIVIGGQPAASRAGEAPNVAKMSVYAPFRAARASEFQSMRSAENTLAQRVRSDAPAPATHSVAGARQDSELSRAPVPRERATAGIALPSSTMSRAPALPGTATGTASGGSVVAKYDALSPGIFAINGKQHDFLITPGGYLTVSGKGFGEAIGQANLIGSFPGGATPLRVVEWRDYEVYLLLPEGLRGVLDQQATVQIITRLGTTYRLDRGRFVAAREELTVTKNLSRLVSVEIPGTWDAAVDANLSVVRYAHRGAVRCSDPGTDYLFFKPPGKGFEIVGVSMSALAPRTDTKADPWRVGTFLPGYSFGAWEDKLPANWGVWKFTPATTEDWTCESAYRIDSLTLFGPAGVEPL